MFKLTTRTWSLSRVSSSVKTVPTRTPRRSKREHFLIILWTKEIYDPKNYATFIHLPSSRSTVIVFDQDAYYISLKPSTVDLSGKTSIN